MQISAWTVLVWMWTVSYCKVKDRIWFFSFLFLSIPNTKRSNKNIMQHITYTVSGWTTKSSLYNSFYRIISRNEEKITQQQLQLQHYSCQAWIPLNDKIDKATIIHIFKFIYFYNILNYLFIFLIVAAFLPFFIVVFYQ